MTDTANGWAWPRGATKPHYFVPRGGQYVSLCGLVHAYASAVEEEIGLTEFAATESCKICSAKQKKSAS